MSGSDGFQIMQAKTLISKGNLVSTSNPSSVKSQLRPSLNNIATGFSRGGRGRHGETSTIPFVRGPGLCPSQHNLNLDGFSLNLNKIKIIEQEFGLLPFKISWLGNHTTLHK